MIHLTHTPTATRRQKKPPADLPVKGKGTVHAAPRIDQETLQDRCDSLNHQITILQRLAKPHGFVVRVDVGGVWMESQNDVSICPLPLLLYRPKCRKENHSMFDAIAARETETKTIGPRFPSGLRVAAGRIPATWGRKIGDAVRGSKYAYPASE